ncbi:phospho-sugar mutase [Ancrocorticia populi]|uniref:Phosphomannomutase n=1 Tax=Ancrocorticia populi TaxID=2175228 RepID=A0A2V1KE56_9ACTO|nr:phospho-sugar mutase [Ancrocorticia populi]PWF27599.1 phosphomannomutase [Ancrocorticia populi]
MSYNLTEVQDWIANDPSEADRGELTALLERAENGDPDAAAELSDRFAGTLQFGTAGLRGAMAAGPNRMNRAVVRRAAAGLVRYLLEKVGDDALLVIGNDARYHSREFAEDTAAIAAAAGIRALIMPRELPTPLLAYAVQHLGADAGVMVTASHNPARDNGYKVYLGGRCADQFGQGVQLVPPADADIAALIAAAPAAGDIPLADTYGAIGEDVIDSYVSETAALVPAMYSRDLKIVYTAMHGVGTPIMRRIFSEAGFENVIEVAEQCTPDPDFPTVPFPNPEELGALDLAKELAASVDADIVIASDPDADRCSAAVPEHGTWRQLSGDEIGSLLGEYLAGGAVLEPGTPTFASSIVSSRMLEQIATSHGLAYQATLTGFKWIARTPHIAYGYEEAIGFCVNPGAVRDKDGLSAGILLAVLASKLRDQGSDLLGELDRLYTKHGVYLSGPVTVRVDDLSIIPATMAKVRTTPPTTLAGSPVARVWDLSEGSDALPATDGIAWFTDAHDRVIIRPSGTEPKVKCYLEVYLPAGSDLQATKAEAAARLEQFKEDVSAALVL